MLSRTSHVLVAFVLGVALAAAVPRAAQAAQLGLSWTDNATDETGYLVERRDGASASFTQIASLPANATAYLDPALPAGSAYCYRVRAFNAIGPSAYTNEACGTAGGALATPLSVSLNQTTFTRSQTMVATVNAVAGQVTTPIDAYVVVQAGGLLLSLQLDGRLVPGLVPIARGIVLPTVSAPFAFPLAGAPPGNYQWLAAVTAPGTLALVSPIAATPFTVVP